MSGRTTRVLVTIGAGVKVVHGARLGQVLGDLDDTGGMWRFAQEDFVKVSYGRCGVACGGLLRAVPQRFYLDDAG